MALRQRCKCSGCGRRRRVAGYHSDRRPRCRDCFVTISRRAAHQIAWQVVDHDPHLIRCAACHRRRNYAGWHSGQRLCRECLEQIKELTEDQTSSSETIVTVKNETNNHRGE